MASNNIPSNLNIPQAVDAEVLDVLCRCGYRWCTKDNRWETRRKSLEITPYEKELLLSKEEIIDGLKN